MKRMLRSVVWLAAIVAMPVEADEVVSIPGPAGQLDVASGPAPLSSAHGYVQLDRTQPCITEEQRDVMRSVVLENQCWGSVRQTKSNAKGESR